MAGHAPSPLAALSPVEQRFDNKTVLVTGAARGIGRASALAFALEGAKVVAADISVEGGAETLRLIREAGGQATFVQTDVSRADQVEDLVRKTLEAHGRLDCAHNNAGISGSRKHAADYSEEDWERVLAVNLKSIWLGMKYEIPAMLQQSGGAIVNTASVAALTGLRWFSAYSASKHAVLGLTKSAALEYYPHGIRINAVCPGLIDTDMVRNVVFGESPDGPPETALLASAKYYLARKVLAAKQPAKRLGLPSEVAKAVLWLCSDAASFVSGHALVVDGGAVVR